MTSPVELTAEERAEGRAAFDNITHNMVQLDQDGINVSVSRQALEAVLTPAARVLYPEVYASRNLTGLGVDETAWLIEAEGTKWFSAGKNSYHWTKDASEALRFARKEDAERFGEWCTISFFMDCKATEHMWPAPSLTVHVPGDKK